METSFRAAWPSEAPPPAQAWPTDRPGRVADLRACRRILARGSRSFSAAALLLPPRVRRPAAAVYAFCRVADDAVDLGAEPRAALHDLHRRLDRVYAGRPDDHPVDRAFTDVVHAFGLPRALPEGLLDGFAWDLEGRRHLSLSGLFAYSARVAGTVGAMMTLLMGQRDPWVLARACDLGVAMQLTNIARDVGEDARAGRLYLPVAWLVEAGLDPDGFLADPRPSEALASVIERLLQTADVLYARADAGIAALPVSSRPAIRAARLIYADIGEEIRFHDWDTVTRRAHTGGARKAVLAARALGAALWRPRPLPEVLLPETRFLVEAVR